MVSSNDDRFKFADLLTAKSNVANLPPGASYQSDLRTGVVDILGKQTDLSPRNHTSIALPLLVTPASTFDFDKLLQLTKCAVVILNKLYDSAVHPPANELNPKDYRPIAIGMHGLADVFTALRMPYDSPAAASLNVRIAETMYYAALEASCELAEKHGAYAAFSTSPLARGILQFDMWDTKASTTYLDWAALRARIQSSGVRNALMIAIGPGAVPHTFSGYTASADPATRFVQPDLLITTDCYGQQRSQPSSMPMASRRVGRTRTLG